MQADVGQRRRRGDGMGIPSSDAQMLDEEDHEDLEFDDAHDALPDASSSRNAIVAMLLVKAIPYYGFHPVMNMKQGLVYKFLNSTV